MIINYLCFYYPNGYLLEIVLGCFFKCFSGCFVNRYKYFTFILHSSLPLCTTLLRASPEEGIFSSREKNFSLVRKNFMPLSRFSSCAYNIATFVSIKNDKTYFYENNDGKRNIRLDCHAM